MLLRQIIGWKADGTKTTGMTTEHARQRGATGQLYREYEQYNPASQQWDVILEPVTEPASA
mgnify:CR=1 FL=1